MTINELIAELCTIRDLAPGNGDMQVCAEQEVQLGELDAPMTDLAVGVAWLDGGNGYGRRSGSGAYLRRSHPQTYAA